MSALDFTPAPGAAPSRARVLAHARAELTQLLRNGEQLLLALVIPIGILVGGWWAGPRLGWNARAFPASVLALALWSTSFTSLAIATAFERRYGVLERLASTPLGKRGLITGKALANATICLGQIVILGVLAALLGWRPAGGFVPVLLAVVVGVGACVTFANLGLMLAGRLRAEAVLGVANTVYVLLAALGALVLPLAAYPGWLRPVLAVLPTAALGESFRAAAAGSTLWWPLVVPLLWAPATTVLTRKVFRWMS